MKKMMALAMAAVMTMAALTGCGGSSDSASGDVPVSYTHLTLPTT